MIAEWAGELLVKGWWSLLFRRLSLGLVLSHYPSSQLFSIPVLLEKDNSVKLEE